MTPLQIKKPYSKYFQKSRTFLYPVLGFKKDQKFTPVQTYLIWEEMVTLKDAKLICVYEDYDDLDWDDFLLHKIMNNVMFDEYYAVEEDMVAATFDLHLIRDDYHKVIEGRYSELSHKLKTKIREYYGHMSPEWAYIQSFLFPKNHITNYSKMLNVDKEHILVTGQLCDKPDFDKETLKQKPNVKHDDVNPLDVEQRKNIQVDPNAH